MIADHLLLLPVLRYNQLVGKLRHLSLRLSTLPANDPFRAKQESQLLSKLYDMGLLDTGAKMSDIMEKISVSGFCRRRLGIVMCKLKMSESVKQVSGEWGVVFELSCVKVKTTDHKRFLLPIAFATRQLLTSSKAKCGWAQMSSQTPPSWSPATWRTLSLGWTRVLSSVPLPSIMASLTTSICCSRCSVRTSEDIACGSQGISILHLYFVSAISTICSFQIVQRKRANSPFGLVQQIPLAVCTFNQ